MPRPSKLTPELLARLKVVFLIGATYKEASLAVGICEKTISNYTKSDPELLQQIEGWRSAPILKAKQTICDNISKDVKVAQWYLERRSPEFKSKQDITTNDQGLPIPILDPVGDILRAAGLLGGSQQDTPQPESEAI